MIISFLDPDISTWIEPRVMPTRTDGPHVSAVLTAMLKDAMPRQYEGYGKTLDGARVPAFELGYTWEDALARALAERVMLTPAQRLMPPQEITRDGIHGTPDRVIFDYDQQRWIVEELKATWYSSSGLESNPGALLDNRKFTYWTLQAKTYAAMLLVHRPIAERQIRNIAEVGAIGAPMVLFSPLARIRALFVNGNYKRSDGADSRAQPMCWQIEWTAAELEQWWAAVVRHVDTPKETPNV
jgi:hypothetical protein